MITRHSQSEILARKFSEITLEPFNNLLNKLEKCRTSGKLENIVQEIEDESMFFMSFIQTAIYGISLHLELLKNESKDGSPLEAVTYPGIAKSLEKSGLSGEIIARKIRNCLNGINEDFPAEQRIIPVLTATWFLAETSRNPMSFLTSLMLLDMIEEKKRYSSKCENVEPEGIYTWKNVLWNPKLLDENQASKLSKTEKYELRAWGGKHSMGRMGSYKDCFQDDSWPEIQNSLEVVRQKEASILINWLKFRIQLLEASNSSKISFLPSTNKKKDTTSTLAIKDNGEEKIIEFQSYNVEKQNLDRTKLQSDVLTQIITPLIKYRMRNFDNQLEPTSSTLKTVFDQESAFFVFDKFLDEGFTKLP